MSGFQEVYLGMVIAAFVLLMAALAWAQIYSRGAAKRSAQPAKSEAGAPGGDRRRAA